MFTFYILRLLLVLFNHDILCNYSMLVIRRVYYLECLLSQVAGMLCPVWVIFHSNIDDAWYHACLNIPPAYLLWLTRLPRYFILQI